MAVAEPALGLQRGGNVMDPHAPPVWGKPLRILVVDDNADAADSLALLLGLLGHAVRTAYDGPATLEVAQAFLPQVVLLDLGLPRMDGYEVARRLRHESGLGEVVLVATTGFGREADRHRCQQAGFDHFLLKPFDLDALVPLLAARQC
jgi:CheY-like chemotaxis protein